MANSDLNSAKKNKKDEFYTQLSDIENELRHYRHHFEGKVVLCNCDDPRCSNFFRYFTLNFEVLKLKKVIATCYKNQDVDLFSLKNCERAVYQIYEGDKNGNKKVDDEEIEVKYLKGDGDFRSPECLELLKEADIVVTNPPFSLFREFVKTLIDYKKKFLIIGNVNAITCKEIFPLIKNNLMWLGYGFTGGNAYFATPHDTNLYANGVVQSDGLVKFRNCHWFTNLDHDKRHEEIPLFRTYSKDDFPQYDNYKAINVDKTSDIPSDYFGVMGVPVTFMDRYNPNQFEILGITKTWFGAASKTYPNQVQIDSDGTRKIVSKLNDACTMQIDNPPLGKTYYEVEGKYYIAIYPRILIRRKVAK